MKKTVIAGLSALCMMGTAAHATTYDLVTTSGVERSENSEALAPQKSFPLKANVYAFLTLRDISESPDTPRTLEARWYVCERLISKRSLAMNDAIKLSTMSNGDNRHHAWFWINAKSMGSGHHKVEVYSDGTMIASTNFDVYNESGTVSPCTKDREKEKPSNPQAIDTQPTNPQATYTLADNMNKNVLFKFNRSREIDLYDAGQTKLDEIAQDLKKSYRVIDKIVVVGHTDRFGSAAYNLKLSKKRANTIRKALLRKGVVARQIQVIAKGESSPVVQCARSLNDSKLVNCLAPNRRVEIIVYSDAIATP